MIDEQEKVLRAIFLIRPKDQFNVDTTYDSLFWEDDTQIKPTKQEFNDAVTAWEIEYPMQLLRAERDKKLKEEVDSKTCEAYNNGTQLSNEWKNYRQALLDMTLQTPTLDENGNLKAGLELDEIYWPTKPE